jgi:RND superfamily putative drug exporter
VPATMDLAGRANWWIPRWLDRLLPHFDHDATAASPREPVPVGGGSTGAGRDR